MSDFPNAFTGLSSLRLSARRLGKEGFAELERLGPDMVQELYDNEHYSPLQSLDVLDWLQTKRADELHSQITQDEAERELSDQARWETQHALTERSVRAAEESAKAANIQAIYAKRAYSRSNAALWLSGIAIVLTAAFALIDFLKP